MLSAASPIATCRIFKLGITATGNRRSRRWRLLRNFFRTGKFCFDAAATRRCCQCGESDPRTKSRSSGRLLLKRVPRHVLRTFGAAFAAAQRLVQSLIILAVRALARSCPRRMAVRRSRKRPLDGLVPPPHSADECRRMAGMHEELEFQRSVPLVSSRCRRPPAADRYPTVLPRHTAA